MSEKETVFSSNIKYKGVFSFKDFYKFCYDWMTEEMGLDVAEEKYNEKVKGNQKEVNFEWKGEDKVTDYFKFQFKSTFKVEDLEDIEVSEGGKKVKTNKGSVKITLKGVLIRDYDGKFETTAFNKFLRSIYEKWVIPARIEQFEDKLFGDCDDFLQQAKAYLDLEGKR